VTFEQAFDVSQYDESSLLVDRHPSGADDTLRMVIHGDLDAVSADRLRGEVGEALRGRPRRIDVDMRGVTFLDSAGIRALLYCHADAERLSTGLVLVNTPAPINRVLEITGLASYLTAGAAD
jgi:anti-anti-sigma factor